MPCHASAKKIAVRLPTNIRDSPTSILDIPSELSSSKGFGSLQSSTVSLWKHNKKRGVHPREYHNIHSKTKQDAKKRATNVNRLEQKHDDDQTSRGSTACFKGISLAPSQHEDLSHEITEFVDLMGAQFEEGVHERIRIVLDIEKVVCSFLGMKGIPNLFLVVPFLIMEIKGCHIPIKQIQFNMETCVSS